MERPLSAARRLLPFIIIGIAMTGAFEAFSLELDERPAIGGEEWGYRPADGESVVQTPPAFTWRPTKGAAAYALEVSSTPGFEQPVYAKTGLTWSAHCPPTPLPAGTYFWRYAASDSSGAQTAWSQPRRFQVGPEAVAFPQPELAQLLERMPKGHPRLFFRPEDVPHLKELSQGALAGRWNDLVAAADKLLANPPDVTEPPKYPEGTVRLSGEWKKIWWGNRDRVEAVGHGAALLAFVYQVSGDERYGRAAADLLMAMTTWDPKGATSFSYNDEAGMPVLYHASRAYSWAYPALRDDERAAITEMMRIRGEETFRILLKREHLWRPYNSHSNRAWHFLGEVAVAFQGAIPDADRWLDFVMTVLYTAYPAWGDADGGWHEGSAYWQSYTERFMYWAFIARSAFGVDVFERPFYKRAGDFPMYVLPPGTQTGAFGDLAPGSTSRSVASLEAILANGAKNNYWKWYADQCKASLPGGPLGFIYASTASDLAATPPSDLPSSKVFRGTGLAVLNSNLLDGTANMQVHFKSSPFGRQSHGYNANNAFLLNMRGQRVLQLSGKRDVHGSPHHTKWMHHSKSDDAILVNGQGQAYGPNATGRITAFATSPGVDVVAGEAGASYTNLDRWARRIVFFKPYAILIHDFLKAPEPSTFAWSLHAKGAFEIADQEVKWAGEPGRVRVRFLEPKGLAFTQTDQFDPPPAEWAKFNLGEWHLTAQCDDPAAQREFLTFIVLDDAQADVAYTQPESGRTEVEVTLPGGSAKVHLAADGFRVEAAGFDQAFTDAQP